MQIMGRTDVCNFKHFMEYEQLSWSITSWALIWICSVFLFFEGEKMKVGSFEGAYKVLAIITLPGVEPRSPTDPYNYFYCLQDLGWTDAD